MVKASSIVLVAGAGIAAYLVYQWYVNNQASIQAAQQGASNGGGGSGGGNSTGQPNVSYNIYLPGGVQAGASPVSGASDPTVASSNVYPVISAAQYGANTPAQNLALLGGGGAIQMPSGNQVGVGGAMYIGIPGTPGYGTQANAVPVLVATGTGVPAQILTGGTAPGGSYLYNTTAGNTVLRPGATTSANVYNPGINYVNTTTTSVAPNTSLSNAAATQGSSQFNLFGGISSLYHSIGGVIANTLSPYFTNQGKTV